MRTEPDFVSVLGRGLLPLLMGLLLGCSAGDNQPTDTDQPPIQMSPILMEDWDAKLAEYPPRILVVDYWATWCVPCIERFPHMVEMAERYTDQGVAFMSLNLDDPTDLFAFEYATDFLNDMNARFEHLAIEENMFKVMEFLGLYSVPAVSIYDRNGIEVARLTGDDPNNQFDEADLERVIEDLLKEQPPL